MNQSTFFEEYKGVAIAVVAAVIFGVIFLGNMAFSTKQLTLANPKEVSFNAGDPYTIQWTAKNVGLVGIVLFNGSKPQWIVQNYPARNGKYVWNSFDYLSAGTDYRIAVFEYPWRKGNKIAYSSNAIEVVGQKYASCQDYSVQQEWPYLPDNYPNSRRVFITTSRWNGNLGGFAGADAKCKAEAEKSNYAGNYIAFIGTNALAASERITKPGVLIEAESMGELAEGRTCHRFLAANIQSFLEKTRLSKDLAQIEFSDTFLRKIADVWYGRRTPSVDTKCLQIPNQKSEALFSNTYTCQDWTIDKRQVRSGAVPEKNDLPKCYDAAGKNIAANFYGAIAGAADSDGSFTAEGDTCDNSHRLICIEQ